jgi:hypothetical protein
MASIGLIEFSIMYTAILRPMSRPVSSELLRVRPDCYELLRIADPAAARQCPVQQGRSDDDAAVLDAT